MATGKGKKSGNPRYVYREAPLDNGSHIFEIGECDNPRSYRIGWCDRRVCEGFWGDEELCRDTVAAMNAAMPRRKK